MVEMLNVGRRKGPTETLESAFLMQPSAEVPAAGPLTDTLWTLPVDAKVRVARDGESCPATQARAAPRCAPTAP